MGEGNLLAVLVFVIVFMGFMFMTFIKKIGELNEINNQVKEMKSIKEFLVSFQMGCKVKSSFRGFSLRCDFYSAEYSHEKKTVIADKYSCDSILVDWNRIYLISDKNGIRTEHDIKFCAFTPNEAISQYNGARNSASSRLHLVGVE